MSLISYLVRLKILEEHGGIWLDPSIVLYEPLDWVYQVNKPVILYNYYGGNNSNQTKLQSWLIAAQKGTRFISDWYKELYSVEAFSNFEKYVTKLDKITLVGFRSDLKGKQLQENFINITAKVVLVKHG